MLSNHHDEVWSTQTEGAHGIFENCPYLFEAQWWNYIEDSQCSRRGTSSNMGSHLHSHLFHCLVDLQTGRLHYSSRGERRHILHHRERLGQCYDQAWWSGPWGHQLECTRKVHSNTEQGRILWGARLTGGRSPVGKYNRGISFSNLFGHWQRVRFHLVSLICLTLDILHLSSSFRQLISNLDDVKTKRYDQDVTERKM